MKTNDPAKTYFAPAERADNAALQRERDALLANHVAMTLLEAIPEFALVVNKQRQIIATNSRLLQVLGVEDSKALLGMRPGEVMCCASVEDSPNGCGTGKRCASCGAVNAVLDALRTESSVTHAAHILKLDGSMEVVVQATFVTVEPCDFVVVAMRDVSAEQRRHVLERVFFHDVLNTIGGVLGLSEYLLEQGLDPAAELECKRNVHRLSRLVIEEIVTHRQLLAAERGDLQVLRKKVDIPALLSDVVALYRHHRVAQARTLRLGPVPNIILSTDEQLLRRVLANLVKNALEATEKLGTVTVWAEERERDIAFMVHNPGAMPDEVQQQIFQRSFSTKAKQGRGVGSYGIKLFTENYLDGHISFTSAEPDGTIFTVLLPKTQLLPSAHNEQ